MKRRTFLAGLAAVTISSKLPPLPAPPAPIALPALPVEVPSAFALTTPGAWCAPLYPGMQDAITAAAKAEHHAAMIEAMDKFKVRRGGIQFKELAGP